MFSLTRLLLIAAVPLCSGASAQDIPGIPRALVGNYGTSLRKCEKPDLEVYEPHFYERSLSPPSSGYIVGHRVTSKGFILNLINRRCDKWTEEVTIIDKNTIKLDSNAGPTTLLRCPSINPAEPPFDFDFRPIPPCNP